MRRVGHHGPKKWEPEGWGPKGVGAKISRYFSLSRRIIRSFLHSLGVFSCLFFSLWGPKISRWCFPLPPQNSFFLPSLGVFSCLFYLSGGPFVSFFLSLEVFSFFCVSGCRFVEFWWCLKRRRPATCARLEFLGCRVKPRRPRSRARLTCTFERPGASNTTKIP